MCTAETWHHTMIQNFLNVWYEQRNLMLWLAFVPDAWQAWICRYRVTFNPPQFSCGLVEVSDVCFGWSRLYVIRLRISLYCMDINQTTLTLPNLPVQDKTARLSWTEKQKWEVIYHASVQKAQKYSDYNCLNKCVNVKTCPISVYVLI